MADVILDNKREVERLFKLEYGDRVEIALRFAVTVLGGVLVFWHTGWGVALFWPVTFAIAHIFYFRFLKRNRVNPRPGVLSVAAGYVGLLLISFIWMPTLLTLHDDLSMVVGGMAVLSATFIFTVRRSDGHLAMVWAESGIVSVASIIAFVNFIPRIPPGIERLGVGFAFAMVAYYFGQAMFIARRHRLAAEAVASRSAQEQKLVAIGQLAGGVAHDFNNILTSISGNLELSFVVDDPDEKEELVRNALASSERAATLVKQLLVYARKSGMSPRPHSAHDILEELKTFSKRLVTASVSTRFEPLQGPLYVHVDKEQLITALINLVVNAVDAMPGGGTLTISAKERSTQGVIHSMDGSELAPGRYLAISVADTGPGIPKHLHPRIVEPFFTTKPVGKGTGLGLSMVLGLAQTAGGGLVIDDSSAGAVVTILLPVLDKVTTEAQPEMAMA